jgi:hypothetical protein
MCSEITNEPCTCNGAVANEVTIRISRDDARHPLGTLGVGSWISGGRRAAMWRIYDTIRAIFDRRDDKPAPVRRSG